MVKFTTIRDEARALQAERETLDVAEPPASLDMTENMHALIETAARNIERAISHPTRSYTPRLREMVRGMVEWMTISRDESGVIEVGVRGAVLAAVSGVFGFAAFA